MTITNKYIFSLRKKFAGNSIFILGSAPSILTNDLTKLRSRFTFGINSSTLLALDNNFVQTFYISTDDKNNDEQLLKKVRNDTTIWDCGTTLLDSSTIRFMPNFIKKYDTEFDINRTFYYCLKGSVNKDVFLNSFSQNISDHIDRYYMTPSSAIEISCYLRFKNIFLLGVDLVYPKAGTHFYNNIKSEYTKSELEKIKTSDEFCKWVYYASKKIYKNGQRIFSCSKTSRLNTLIEYVDFENAIKMSRN